MACRSSASVNSLSLGASRTRPGPGHGSGPSPPPVSCFAPPPPSLGFVGGGAHVVVFGGGPARAHASIDQTSAGPSRRPRAGGVAEPENSIGASVRAEAGKPFVGGRLGGFAWASAEPQQFPMEYGTVPSKPTTRSSSLPPRSQGARGAARACALVLLLGARVLRRCVLQLQLLLLIRR